MSLIALVPALLPVVAGEPGVPVVVLGILGLSLAIGGAVAGRIALIGLSATVLLVQLAVAIEPGAASAWWVIGYVAGLFALLDVGAGVVERRNRLPGPFGGQVPRLLALASGAATVSAIVLLLARVPLERGVLVQAAGLGAAATLFLVVAALTRGQPSE